jgi:Rapamycin-insensitive companion of mTOR, middle domain
MLYDALTEDDTGRAMLMSDKKALIFTEINREIEHVIAQTGNDFASQVQKCLLKPMNCTQSMAREYFTLLGNIICSSGGKEIMEGTSLFRTLSSLGSMKNLDYLSRIALTNLAFSDYGFFSKHLVQLWSVPGAKASSGPSCSVELMLHVHLVMRSLFRSRPGKSLNSAYVCFVFFFVHVPFLEVRLKSYLF